MFITKKNSNKKHVYDSLIGKVRLYDQMLNHFLANCDGGVGGLRKHWRERKLPRRSLEPSTEG